MNEPKRAEGLRGAIHLWHHDHFGHMNVRPFVPFFDDGCYPLWAAPGIGYDRMQERHGVHCATAQASTGFAKELVAGDLIVIDKTVTRVGTKGATFDLRMPDEGTGALRAICEVLEVLLDPHLCKAAPLPQEVRMGADGFNG